MRWLFMVLAVATALGARVQDEDDKNPAPIPGWLQDLAAGFAEAKATGKPMLVVFR